MHSGSITLKSLLITVALLFLYSGLCQAQSKVGTAGVSFLEFSNSARITGLGGCSAGLIDEQSIFTNPGAACLFHYDKILAVNIPLMIDRPAGLEQISFNAGVKIMPTLFGPRDNHGLEYWSMIGFSMTNLKAANIINTNYYYPLGPDDWGEAESISATDKVCALSAGLGLAVGRIKMALGYSLKSIREKLDTLEAQGLAHDLGAIVSLSIINAADYEKLSKKYVSTLDAALGFSILHLGGAMEFGQNEFSLPTTDHIGLSGTYQLIGGRGPIFSLMPIIQCDNLLHTANQEKILRIGLETALWNSIYFRFGNNNQGDSRHHWGGGVSIMEFIRHFIIKHKSNNYIFRNLDIRFDYGYEDIKYLESVHYFNILIAM